MHAALDVDDAAPLAALAEGRGEHVDRVACGGLAGGEVADLRLDPAGPGRVAVGHVGDDHGRQASPVSTTNRPPDPCPSAPAHSHSMVPGGLLVTSRTTRLTSRTSLVMRVEMVASTS